ncbi:response regulator [Maribacter sp. 2-571]|uniref:response regulator n=1 Tax=Maribacter sp. 2-571 TaxID=3417569 RepID=UPI003D32E053
MALSIGIIDDDLVSQYATQYCIEQTLSESKVLVWDSGEEALSQFIKFLQEGKPLPDILFLDLVMGGMNGWEFLEAIRPLTGKKQKTQIYILSAFTNTKDRELAKKHTMIKGYFDKPLSKSMMSSILVSQTL